MTMDMDSDEPTRRKDKLLENEMRSHRNRGFHNGYDDGKKAVIQEALDTGYKKAFEQNFILSTLKGVANALKSSYNLNQSQQEQSIPPPSIATATATATTTTQPPSTSPPPPPSTPASSISSSSASDLNSSSSISSTPTTSSANIRGGSPHHLRMLESMRFDNTSDIESIKNDLITICRENRLEILAHYVSQIR